MHHLQGSADTLVKTNTLARLRSLAVVLLPSSGVTLLRTFLLAASNTGRSSLLSLWGMWKLPVPLRLAAPPLLNLSTSFMSGLRSRVPGGRRSVSWERMWQSEWPVWPTQQRQHTSRAWPSPPHTRRALWCTGGRLLAQPCCPPEAVVCHFELNNSSRLGL
jgi:hypothetical protein